MNVFNLAFGAIFIIFFVSYFFAGSYNSVTSIFSVLFALLITLLVEDGAISWIGRLGWKENVYSPSFVLIVLFIVLWGIFFSIFSYIISNKSGENKLKRVGLAIVASAITVAAVSSLLCFGLPAFFTSQETTLKLKNSLICVSCLASRYENIRPKSLQVAQGRAITPQSNNEIVTLPESFAFLGQSYSLESRLMELINQTRLNNQINELARSDKLNQLAFSYARSMVETKRFSHIDSQNSSPSDRARSAKINFNYYGENLAVASTVDKAHEAIMQSDSHRENLLSTAYRQIGIAVIHIEPNEVMVVEEFSN